MAELSPHDLIKKICKILWPSGREADDSKWDAKICDEIADLLAAHGHGREPDPNECDECEGTGLNTKGRLVKATSKTDPVKLLKSYPCPYCRGTGMILRRQKEKGSS